TRWPTPPSGPGVTGSPSRRPARPEPPGGRQRAAGRIRQPADRTATEATALSTNSEPDLSTDRGGIQMILSGRSSGVYLWDEADSALLVPERLIIEHQRRVGPVPVALWVTLRYLAL